MQASDLRATSDPTTAKTPSELEFNPWTSCESQRDQRVKNWISVNIETWEWNLRRRDETCYHGHFDAHIHHTSCAPIDHDRAEPFQFISASGYELRDYLLAMHLQTFSWLYRHLLYTHPCRRLRQFDDLNPEQSTLVRQILAAFVQTTTHRYRIDEVTAIDHDLWESSELGETQPPYSFHQMLALSKVLVTRREIPHWPPLARTQTINGVRILVRQFKSSEEAGLIIESDEDPAPYTMLLSSTHIVTAVRTSEQTYIDLEELWFKRERRLCFNPKVASLMTRIFDGAARSRSRRLRNLPTEILDQILSHLSFNERYTLAREVPVFWPHLYFFNKSYFGDHLIKAGANPSFTFLRSTAEIQLGTPILFHIFTDEEDLSLEHESLQRLQDLPSFSSQILFGLPSGGVPLFMSLKDGSRKSRCGLAILTDKATGRFIMDIF